MSSRITTEFEGTCYRCGERIAAKERVTLTQAGIRHPGCPEAKVTVRKLTPEEQQTDRPDFRPKRPPRPRATIEEIVKALGGRIRWRPSFGRWLAVHCPAHHDRHASAGISPDGKIFVCHACEISTADRVDLVMRVKGCGFYEAVDFIRGLESD